MANRYADHCPYGHPTPLSSDRTPSGFCRRCKRDNARRTRGQIAVVLAEARRMAGLMSNP